MIVYLLLNYIIDIKNMFSFQWVSKILVQQKIETTVEKIQSQELQRVN